MKETSLALALSGLGFILSVIWGGPLIRILKALKIGKMIRVEGPDSHMSKMGTPTMGGVMFIVPVTLMTGLLNAASLLGLTVLGRSVILPLGVMIAFGILGAVDDWEGIRGPAVDWECVHAPNSFCRSSWRLAQPWFSTTFWMFPICTGREQMSQSRSESGTFPWQLS